MCRQMLQEAQPHRLAPSASNFIPIKSELLLFNGLNPISLGHSAERASHKSQMELS